MPWNLKKCESQVAGGVDERLGDGVKDEPGAKADTYDAAS